MQVKCMRSKGVRHSLCGQDRLAWREWSDNKSRQNKGEDFCPKVMVKTSQVTIRICT